MAMFYVIQRRGDTVVAQCAHCNAYAIWLITVPRGCTYGEPVSCRICALTTQLQIEKWIQQQQQPNCVQRCPTLCKTIADACAEASKLPVIHIVNPPPAS